MQNQFSKADVERSALKTRPQRRRRVGHISAALQMIRDLEQESLRHYPESLRETDQYLQGELAVDLLDEVIDLLDEIY